MGSTAQDNSQNTTSSSTSKRKQLHRVVRQKSESHEYLPALYRKKPFGSYKEYLPDGEDLALLYDVRTPRFTMDIPTASKRVQETKFYGSQPMLGPRHTRKTGQNLDRSVSVSLPSFQSSSVPNDLNLAGVQKPLSK